MGVALQEGLSNVLLRALNFSVLAQALSCNGSGFPICPSTIFMEGG